MDESKQFLSNSSDITNKDICSLFGQAPAIEIKSLPFLPQWAFGMNVDVKFFNLTTEKTKWKIFYTVTHVGVIYNYKINNMRFLLGHKNYITSISVDSTGKWLATADNGTDNSVIIWDSEDCFPICTIYEPYGEDGVIQLALSQNGKYLVTLGNESEQPVIKFWLWTLGNDTPEAKYTINKAYGEIKIITFNPNKCEHFAITFSEAVLFCTWNFVTKTIKVLEGEIITEKPKNYGTFNDTTYLYLSHQCYTVTSNGWVIIWGLTFFTVVYESIPASNDKIFIKAIRLQKDAIRAIYTVDNNYLATTNLNGLIKFYDRKFRITFQTHPSFIPLAVLISFNVGTLSVEFQDPTVFDSDREEEEELFKKDEDRSEENEKIFANLLPSDYTLQRAPFLTQDYIILTTDGQFAYVDAIKNKYYYFLNTNYYPVTSMDIHSEKPILCVGYKDGAINSYNYEKRILIVKRTITKSKEETYNQISSIRFSYKGLFLACGTSGGCVWFLDPVTLEPVYKKPFFYDHIKILDIKFSLDNLYLAYYDNSFAVCVLKRCISDDKVQHWIFYGRYVAHTKPIVGLVFCRGCKLFSVAQDNFIVEYYVNGSKLEILSRKSFMQRGCPVYFTNFNVSRQPDAEDFFLISTKDQKYLIIQEKNNDVDRIVLSPRVGQPIQQIKIIPNRDEKYMIYMSGKYLGIQKIPLSASPFKQICLVAHSSSLHKFCVSKSGQYVFTYGEKDNVCIMWKINPEPLEKLEREGGEELKPYYSLIEGGPNGWLFQEMRDLFYYMQILYQGDDSPAPRKTSDKIPIIELPNLMRAIGYFPTESELGNILIGVKYYVSQTEDEDAEEISFENFVKLYINHRLVTRYNTEDFKWAFQVLGNEDGIIPREKFIKLLCEEGEAFTPLSLQHCISILTHHEDSEDKPRHMWKEMLPNELTYQYFVSEILGVEDKDLTE